MKTFRVVGLNEWSQGKRTLVVQAKNAKEAKELALNTRTIDGGVVSCREVKSKKKSGVISIE